MPRAGSCLRHLRAPAISLLLGIALTVATCWTLVFLPVTSMHSPPHEPGVPREWPLALAEAWGPPADRSITYQPPGRRLVTNSTIEDGEEWVRSDWRQLEREEFGWPLLALSSYRIGNGLATPIFTPAPGLDGGMDAPFRRGQTSSSRDIWRLPVRPLWPGFAINALFYAVLACPLVIAPGAWRRARRRRRGRCARCNYDLAGLSRCHKCGTRE